MSRLTPMLLARSPYMNPAVQRKLRSHIVITEALLSLSAASSPRLLCNNNSACGAFSELCFRYLKEMFPPRRAHICAQHSSTAGLCCLSEEYTAIVPVFTLDTLHRWPNGAVAAQLALARNPEGSVCRNKQ